MRRKLAPVAVVLGGLMLAGGCAGIGGATSFGDESRPGQVDSIRLADVDGKVVVRSGAVARVSRVVHHSDDRPGRTHRMRGRALELGPCRLRGCWVDYDVVVPRGVPVAGRVASGDVEVVRQASAQLQVDSGSVAVRGVPGTVTVDASSGDVEGSGLAGRASVRADSGSVDLGMRTARDVLVEAASGDISVTVPGGRYRVRSVVDSGNEDIGIREDPRAPHTLDLHADSGDITVRPG